MLRKAILTTFVLLLAVATANADFYVIGTGGKRYKRTVVVSPVPGNPTASGAALLAAYNGVTGATAADPWLVKLEPGIYDLGATSLSTQAYVDLEGSGAGVTAISGSSTPLTAGASVEVRGLRVVCQAIATTTAMAVSGDASLRDMRIEANSSGSTAYGLSMSSASPRLLDTTISVTGAGGTRGISASSSQVRLANVTIQAEGAGPNLCIYSQNASTLDLTGCTLTTQGGTYCFGLQNFGTTLTAMNCRFDISAVNYAYAIRNNSNSETTLTACRVLARGADTVRNAVLNFGAGALFTAQGCELLADPVSPASNNNDSVRNESNATAIYLDGCKVGAMSNLSDTYDVFVGASRVDGTVTGSLFVCTGCYDGAYSALDGHCQ